MVQLSVNVNKVATVRNSRGGSTPSVLEAAKVCIHAGAHGITVHPREDGRHIRPLDVRQLGELLREYPDCEFNVEGDPRPDFVALVKEVQPDQCTLVPVLAGEVTSQGGWPTTTDETHLRRVVSELKAIGIRVSVFVDAQPDAVEWVRSLGADRVELFTEPFAQAFLGDSEQALRVFDRFKVTAEAAHKLGLGVNAGHDLDVSNLGLFKRLPHLAEVSIGHALVSQALFEGLNATVKKYLKVLSHVEAH